MEKRQFHCIPPVWFEFIFYVHKNIIFIIKNIKKHTYHLASECRHRQKKMPAYIYADLKGP